FGGEVFAYRSDLSGKSVRMDEGSNSPTIFPRESDEEGWNVSAAIVRMGGEQANFGASDRFEAQFEGRRLRFELEVPFSPVHKPRVGGKAMAFHTKRALFFQMFAAPGRIAGAVVTVVISLAIAQAWFGSGSLA